LARLVAAGERSPVEVVQAHLERIEAVGKDFNGGILLGKTNLPEMSY
jgi:Asp-tRNA(Asn)/Glu-tRNA(Gln) amidotransferase A subunit family amidase